MENKLTQEQIAIIEVNKNNQSRSGCTILNNIQKEITGNGSSDCFCSATARRQFLEQFNIWYNAYTNE